MNLNLRDYQQECIDTIIRKPPGRYLIQMATGLGKTVTFANIPRQGRTLLLSHREELVNQPRKYFSCSFGVEQGKNKSNGEEVVSASVQSIARRLERFTPDEFDMIICDEAHHAAARTYKKIFNYFNPRLLLGFTATPNRADGVRLNDSFSEIIFQRDLKWGIKNGYLSDIFCRRVDIGYDLTNVSTRCGDYAPGELDEAMSDTSDAIAEAYRKYAKGATLIFAVSVRHAESIASKIPGAVVVTGKTENRAEIIKKFSKREIPCIVNCMVFTEGTDIPLVETVIIARPTKSDSLYAQMVGRGLRLHPDKERLILIDCVGVTGTASLCTAPSLLGISLENIPKEKRQQVEGDLFDLPKLITEATDCPQSWIRNTEIVDLWAKEQTYNLHNMNWFQMPDGELVLSLSGKKLKIPCQDELGNVVLNGEKIPMQQALDKAYTYVSENYEDQKYLWDLSCVQRWSKSPASEKQLNIINRRFPDFDTENLSKGQASQILNRIFGGRR
ncbi:MAG: DEAD/DEAH box helicase [Lachnospiraceae bacterium]|nr:DEAD/DEAH box helicase [Lachnospiraceae bacterium]